MYIQIQKMRLSTNDIADRLSASDLHVNDYRTSTDSSCVAVPISTLIYCIHSIVEHRLSNNTDLSKIRSRKPTENKENQQKTQTNKS